MKPNSLDISGRLPSDLVAALQALIPTARREGVSLFVVGATARDILMDYAYGMKSPRVSMDIDVALRVRDWVEYLGFTGDLVNNNQLL